MSSSSSPFSEADWIRYIDETEKRFAADGSAYTNHTVIPSLQSIIKRTMFRHPELAGYTDFLTPLEQKPLLKEAAMQKMITESNYTAYLALCEEIDFAQAGPRFSPQWLNDWPSYDHILYEAPSKLLSPDLIPS